MDKPVLTILNPNGDSDWLLVCEHASNHVPSHLNQLGLNDDLLSSHIAYDIGAEDMTRYLAEKLNATAVIAQVSRLVIDCNRALSNPACIPPISDGVMIPANQDLTLSARQARIHEIFLPFHQAVTQTLADKLAANPNTKLLNIHSFTPQLADDIEPRPWHIGFLHRQTEPTQSVIHALQQNTDYCIGDNQPYNGFVITGYTVPAHADAQEIPSLLVEFRQDLINHNDGVIHWGDLLLKAMQPSAK